MITINAAAWAWPQITMIVMFFIHLFCGASLHGTPRTPYNMGWVIVDTAWLVFLLSAGGFFS